MSRSVTLLRQDLLSSHAIVLAGSTSWSEELTALGARVERFDRLGELDDEAAVAWVRQRVPLDALVYDATPALRAGGLSLTLERGWQAVRAVANGALIPGENGGKVVLVAPSSGEVGEAHAARAALENLARTLSVEWARYSITTTTIAPSPSTRGRDIATLVAFLASRAGDYFSGCRFELGSIYS